MHALPLPPGPRPPTPIPSTIAVALLLLAPLANPLRADSLEQSSAFQPRRVSLTDLKARSAWDNVGTATPEACFETYFWAHDREQIDVLRGTLLIEQPAFDAAQKALAALPESERALYETPDRLIAILLTRTTRVSALRVLGSKVHPQRPGEVALHWMNAYDDGRLRENKNFVLRATPGGWRRVITARSIEMLLLHRLHDDGSRRRVASGPLPKSDPSAPQLPLAPGLVAIESMRNRGMGSPVATLETLYWAKHRGDLATLEKMIVVTPGARAKAEAQLAALSAHGRARMPNVTTPERMIIAQWISSTREIGFQLDLETEISPGRVYLSGRRQDERGRSNVDLVLRQTDEGWKWFMGDMPASLPLASAGKQ